MFFIESGFLNNPLSFGFNTVKQIFLFFFMFSIFRDFSNVKQTQTFCHIIFAENRRTGEEEVNGERHEVQKRAHHVGQEAG
jgi:hypothetical protein